MSRWGLAVGTARFDAILSIHRRTRGGRRFRRGGTGCGRTHWPCHSEEPAGDEEFRIVLKTLKRRDVSLLLRMTALRHFSASSEAPPFRQPHPSMARNAARFLLESSADGTKRRRRMPKPKKSAPSSNGAEVSGVVTVGVDVEGLRFRIAAVSASLVAG